MRKRSHVSDEEAEVNMTPMLDIVFIMLIFFIVTATFIQESGLDVSRPDPNQEQEKNDSKVRPVLIQLTDDNKVFLDRREVDVRSVRANVEKRRAENPKTPVIIQAGRESEVGLLVSVMDQSQQAGAAISIAPLVGQPGR